MAFGADLSCHRPAFQPFAQSTSRKSPGLRDCSLLSCLRNAPGLEMMGKCQVLIFTSQQRQMGGGSGIVINIHQLVIRIQNAVEHFWIRGTIPAETQGSLFALLQFRRMERGREGESEALEEVVSGGWWNVLLRGAVLNFFQSFFFC